MIIPFSNSISPMETPLPVCPFRQGCFPFAGDLLRTFQALPARRRHRRTVLLENDRTAADKSSPPGSDLFQERQYRPQYRVRADYEHFLWCYFEKKAQFTYVPTCVVSYEGGGFSETRENERQSAREHREITGIYMTLGQRFRYRTYLILTLAPLRHALATNPKFADAYNNIVKKFYHR